MLFNNNNFSVLFKYKIEKLSKKIKAAKQMLFYEKRFKTITKYRKLNNEAVNC